MYRIKLASGNETTYNSIDELTAAVQEGEVNAGALIYHQRADRWLSVTNHPHYVIALSRIQAPSQPAADASRRQVVNAVRPPAPESAAPRAGARSEPEVPPTVARAQIFEVVAEMENRQEQTRTAKRLSIPTVKKPEPSALRAHENVLEGVVVNKPAPTHGNGAGNSNGQPPANGGHARPHQTTALPYRSAAAPVKDPAPKVPDLGDGLDLVEPETTTRKPAVGGNGAHPTSGTPVREEAPEMPQVDKLLSLLESSPSTPGTAAAVPVPEAPRAEIIGLNSPAPVRTPARKEPVLDAPIVSTEAPLFDSHAMDEPIHPPIVRARKNTGPALIGVAAAAVILIGLVIWHPWTGKAAPSPTTELASTQAPRTEAFGGLSSVGAPSGPASTPSATPGASGQPVDSAARSAKPEADSAPSIIRVVAPRVNMNIPLPAGQLLDVNARRGAGINISASTLTQHYTEAYNDARSELELRMLQIGFTQIFLRSRLTTTSGLQDTRRLIGSAASALRQYRSQEARIERAYQDTVGSGGKNLGWTARDLGTWNTRTSQREAPETLRLTNLLLSQMDSVFSLLQDQDGKYQFAGEAIVFNDAETARQYGALRAWLTQQADSYAGSGETALPGTLRQVIKAIGNTRLPQERRS